MKNFTDVPLPIWMQKLPKDRRGYPVPVMVMRDKDGRPHFTINDEEIRQRVIKKDRCAICGSKLLKRRALVGGPGSAFLDGGAYIDPAMHLECARYALQVCPYLAAPRYVKRIDALTVDPAKIDNVIFQDPTVDPKRPTLFVLVNHTRTRHIMGSYGMVKYLKPSKPYFDVEYWKDGIQLERAEGEALTKQHLVEFLANDQEAAMEGG